MHSNRPARTAVQGMQLSYLLRRLDSSGENFEIINVILSREMNQWWGEVNKIIGGAQHRTHSLSLNEGQLAGSKFGSIHEFCFEHEMSYTCGNSNEGECTRHTQSRPQETGRGPRLSVQAERDQGKPGAIINFGL